MNFSGKTGYITIWNTPCIYVEEENQLLLIPQNPGSHLCQPIELLNSNFEIEYSDNSIFKNTALINQVNWGFNNSQVLYAEYIFKDYYEKMFDSMSITGPVLDDFFRPSRYFYRLAQSGNLPKNNLIYDSKLADSWDISFESEIIRIELSYGNILNNGIMSDLKLRPMLTVNFQPTSNTQYIYQIYCNILRFLQITRYNPKCGKMHIEMHYSHGNAGPSNGCLIDYSEINNDCGGGTLELNYDTYKPYIKRLLTFAFSNSNISISHYPELGFRRFSDGYTSTDYMNLFAAFECECHGNKSLYETADTSRLLDIKNQLLSLINDHHFKDLDETEKSFLENVKNSIHKLGTQFGQKKKITNAYSILSGALNSSLIYIFLDENSIKDTESRDKLLSNVAKQLTEIRGKIVHGDFNGVLPSEKYHIIRFFEILIYSMLLKRANLNDDEIEIIIGLVFNCNTAYTDKLRKISNTHS